MAFHVIEATFTRPRLGEVFIPGQRHRLFVQGKTIRDLYSAKRIPYGSAQAFLQNWDDIIVVPEKA